MVSKLGTFFGKLGHLVLKGLHLVGQVVTDEQVQIALTFVRQANAHYADNTRRREFAVARVQAATHVPESLARYLVEFAVQMEKKELEHGLQKLEEVLGDDAQPEALPEGVVSGAVLADLQNKFLFLKASYESVLAELEQAKASLAQSAVAEKKK